MDAWVLSQIAKDQLSRSDHVGWYEFSAGSPPRKKLVGQRSADQPDSDLDSRHDIAQIYHDDRVTSSPTPKNIYRVSHPYPMYPGRSNVILQFKGDLNTMADCWTPAEMEIGRRVVQFRRTQTDNVISVSFEAISLEERSPNSICVSCIWREEAQTYYVTSVDTISLLESLVETRFTVEEKNRIRRNLEGFRPTIISKTDEGSPEFFKLIMGFPNPKPRNIEKDVKVFPWRVLATALEKIVGKYFASYVNTGQSESLSRPLFHQTSAQTIRHPTPPPLHTTLSFTSVDESINASSADKEGVYKEESPIRVPHPGVRETLSHEDAESSTISLGVEADRKQGSVESSIESSDINEFDINASISGLQDRVQRLFQLTASWNTAVDVQTQTSHLLRHRGRQARSRSVSRNRGRSQSASGSQCSGDGCRLTLGVNVTPLTLCSQRRALSEPPRLASWTSPGSTPTIRPQTVHLRPYYRQVGTDGGAGSGTAISVAQTHQAPGQERESKRVLPAQRDAEGDGNDDEEPRPKKRRQHESVLNMDKHLPCLFLVGEPDTFGHHTTSFPHILILMRHLRSHDFHACPKCFTAFPSEDALQAHKTTPCGKSCGHRACKRYRRMDRTPPASCSCIFTAEQQWNELFHLKYPDKALPENLGRAAPVPMTRTDPSPNDSLAFTPVPTADFNLVDPLLDFDDINSFPDPFADKVTSVTESRLQEEVESLREQVRNLQQQLAQSQSVQELVKIRRQVCVLEQRVAQPPSQQRMVEGLLEMVWQLLVGSGHPQTQPEHPLCKMVAAAITTGSPPVQQQSVPDIALTEADDGYCASLLNTGMPNGGKGKGAMYGQRTDSAYGSTLT